MFLQRDRVNLFQFIYSRIRIRLYDFLPLNYMIIILYNMLLYMPCVWFVFVTKYNICYFGLIAYATKRRTRFTTKSNALVCAFQFLRARFVARRSIAIIAAYFGTLKMFTFPNTRFLIRIITT